MPLSYAEISMRITIFILALIWVGFLSAQTDDSPDETKSSTKNTPTEASNNQETRKPKPKDKVFIPTEEISEDTSVPFPVDI